MKTCFFFFANFVNSSIINGTGASQLVLVVKKDLPPNAGNIRDVGSILRWGRSTRRGNGNPLQYSCCLENPRGQRSLSIGSQRGRPDGGDLARTRINGMQHPFRVFVAGANVHARLVVLGRKVQVLCNIYILFLNFLNVGNSKEKSRHSGIMNPALARWAWGSCPELAQCHLRARDPLPQTSAHLLCDRLRAGLLSVPRCCPDAAGASSHPRVPGAPQRCGVFGPPLMVPFPSFQASGCFPFSFPFVPGFDFLKKPAFPCGT